MNDTIECSEEQAFGMRWLILGGRVDAMSAEEIQRRLDGLLGEGERNIGRPRRMLAALASTSCSAK